MAFQQPQRQRTTYTTNQPTLQTTSLPFANELAPQQSREWIIFSPNSTAVTESQTASTARTPRTAGRSHLSELGSLETGAGSNHGEEDEEADTEDMDSLDDGLHAFHEPVISHVQSRPVHRSSIDTLLPAHDGLGMFTASSTEVQEQFWQHERYNPRRRRQSIRRPSFQQRFEALQEEQAHTPADERIRRIEEWRMDQSKAILEEVERETRRQRRREQHAGTVPTSPTEETDEAGASLSNAEDISRCEPPEPETFWTKFTRRVIRDLMGFDDVTLSLIFGEALVAEDDSIPTAYEIIEEAERTVADDAQLMRQEGSWQERLLARIAKELGVLVHKLAEDPGAFSTYVRSQDPPLYAGLVRPVLVPEIIAERAWTQPSLTTQPLLPTASQSAASAHFRPTLRPRTHIRHSSTSNDPSLWGIEEEGEDIPPASASRSHVEDTTQQNEHEYWEQQLDIKAIFRFLRNRLSLSRRAQSQQQEPGPAPRTAAASASTRRDADSLRRAALIRRHHPLVSRNMAAAASASQTQSDQLRLSVRPTAAAPAPVLGRRHSGRDDSGSCASHSTKRSKTGRSGSSRNYWDVGTGSLGSGGWNAGWGEV